MKVFMIPEGLLIQGANKLPKYVKVCVNSDCLLLTFFSEWPEEEKCHTVRKTSSGYLVDGLQREWREKCGINPWKLAALCEESPEKTKLPHKWENPQTLSVSIPQSLKRQISRY